MSSASLNLLIPPGAVDFAQPHPLRAPTLFLLQQPDTRSPVPLITPLQFQNLIPSNPHQDSVTYLKLNSDRVLPSLNPFGGF